MTKHRTNGNDEVWRQALGRLEALNGEEMQHWLLIALSGRDTILPLAKDSSPAYSIRLAYGYLTRHAREYLVEAALVLLRGLANGGLQPACCEELLFLIQHLELPEAGEVLEALAKSDGFASLDENLQFRILQTLVALRFPLEPDFWLEAAKLDPSRYTGLAFEGLALNSWQLAVSALLQVEDSNRAADQIGNALPLFWDKLDEEDRFKVRRQLEGILSQLPPAVRATVLDFFEDEGSPLHADMAADDLIDRTAFADFALSLWTVSRTQVQLLGQPAMAAI
jgi:hypothetical protein